MRLNAFLIHFVHIFVDFCVIGLHFCMTFCRTKAVTKIRSFGYGLQLEFWVGDGLVRTELALVV